MSKIERIYPESGSHRKTRTAKQRLWRRHSPSFLSDKNNPALATSPWSGHRTFAYDLVSAIKPKRIVELGTHYGCSFFTFAQAILDKEIGTELIAIDTWKGDEHAGLYGEDVFQLVNSTIADHFSELEINLIRSTFSEALPNIEDGSVDLLHIDGFHSYEAAKQDFETWKRKLAPDAIVLFHDIAPASGYGSANYWREIRSQHPHAQFLRHSFGLGILFPVGTAKLDKYRDSFKPLSMNYYMYRAQTDLLEKQVSDTAKMLEDRYAVMLQMDRDIAERDRAIRSQESRIDQLNEIIKDAQQDNLNYSDRVKELRDTIGANDRMLLERFEIMQQMDAQIEARDALIKSYEKRFEEFEVKRAQDDKAIAEYVEQISALEQQSSKNASELFAASELLDKRFEIMQQMDAQIEARDEQVSRYEKQLATLTQELEIRDKEIAKSVAQVRALEECGVQKDKDLADFADALSNSRSALEVKENVIQNLQAEIANLTDDVLDLNAEVSGLNAKTEHLLSEITHLETSSLSQTQEIRALSEQCSHRRPYGRLSQVYNSDATPRRKIRKILNSISGDRNFPEMAVSLYAFTRLLLDTTKSKGVKHLFFLAREGQILMDMFLRLQRAMYPPEEHITCHYLKVSRRSTFLMSLKPLNQEDFHVLFRQYRAISIAEFLKSLSLDAFIPEIADQLQIPFETLAERCEDLPTAPVFQSLISNVRFQEIYESERVRRIENFAQYLRQFNSDVFDTNQFHIVDVGWKGSIQDNLYNWMSMYAGRETIVDGYYLGLVALGSSHELNTKSGLLLDTVGAKESGARVFNENRALFEILLPADHGSANDYVEDNSGNITAVDQVFDEEHMIAAHVRPITDNFSDLFYVMCDTIDHHNYALDSVFDDAKHFHARMMFNPTTAEKDWFHSISHVENFGLFEESRFNNDALGSNLLDRARFTYNLRFPEFRQRLGFWPWLKIRSKGLPFVAKLYGWRQIAKS